MAIRTEYVDWSARASTLVGRAVSRHLKTVATEVKRCRRIPRAETKLNERRRATFHCRMRLNSETLSKKCTFSAPDQQLPRRDIFEPRSLDITQPIPTPFPSFLQRQGLRLSRTKPYSVPVKHQNANPRCIINHKPNRNEPSSLPKLKTLRASGSVQSFDYLIGIPLKRAVRTITQAASESDV